MNPEKSKFNSCINQAILKPYSYMRRVPGKGVRKEFTNVMNYYMQIPDDKLELISEIVNQLHETSLLIDDIQDRSVMRRGAPTAYRIYGITNTLNCASYLWSLVLEKVFSLNHPRDKLSLNGKLSFDKLQATEIYLNELVEVLKGQGMELYWRDSFVCPTEDEYTTMAIRKTGTPYILAIKLMQLFCDNQFKNIGLTFAESIGLSYQINDDCQSLTNKIYFDKKGFCEDIEEGKFSFPILHSVNNNPEVGALIKDILSQRTNDIGLKKQCISLINQCGSFEYTRKKIEDIGKIIAQELEAFGPNPLMKSLFLIFSSQLFVESNIKLN